MKFSMKDLLSKFGHIYLRNPEWKISFFFCSGIQTNLQMKKNQTETSCSNFIIIWCQSWWAENNNFIVTIKCFDKTLKSLHFNGKSSFLVNLNTKKTKFCRARSWSIFLLLLQRLIDLWCSFHCFSLRYSRPVRIILNVKKLASFLIISVFTKLQSLNVTLCTFYKKLNLNFGQVFSGTPETYPSQRMKEWINVYVSIWTLNAYQVT